MPIDGQDIANGVVVIHGGIASWIDHGNQSS